MKSFCLGRLLATPAALEACKEAGVSPFNYFSRHGRQDWGDLCSLDKRLNDEALEDGGRILSSYILPNGVKLWVITEADDGEGNRAATTLLRAGEY